MTDPICIPIPPFPDPFVVPLPGGAEIEDINPVKALQPALTPLMPFFDIIDALVATYACLKAIPAALGPPPDPSALASALPDLAKKLSKLLGLLPQVALPRTIVRIVMLVVATLRIVRDQLVHLQTQLKQIEHVVDRAKQLNDPRLMAIAACARGNVAQEAANVGKGLASVGRLLGMVNLFMGLIGGPKVPDLSAVSGSSLDESVPRLDELVHVLEGVVALVPGA